MKKLIAKLFGQTPATANLAETKLGSENDPVRQMLFANQSMEELLKNVQLDGEPGPFQSISDSAKLAKQGKKAEAIEALRKILEEKMLETRLELWVWSCLRELGEYPDEKMDGEVLGVVIEVPCGGSYDTLAAYVDGTARYLNFSGAAIFWDVEDAKIKSLCQGFVDSSIPESGRATSRQSLLLPKRGSQVTLLTRSGIYAISNPSEAVEVAGAKLMVELIKRTEEGKGE